MMRTAVIGGVVWILVLSTVAQNVSSLGGGLMLSRDVAFFESFEDGSISEWQVQVTPGNWVTLGDPPPNSKGSFGYPSAWSLWILSRPDPGGGLASGLSPVFAPIPAPNGYLVSFDVYLTDLGGSGFVLGDDGVFTLTLESGFDLYGHGVGAPVLLARIEPTKWYRIEARVQFALDAHYEVLVNGTYLGDVDVSDGIPPGQRLVLGDDDPSAMTWGEAFFDNIIVSALVPTPWVEHFADGEAGDWTLVEASCSDLVEVTDGPSGEVLHMWFNTSARCLSDQGPSLARAYSPHPALVRNWSFEVLFRFQIVSPDSSWFTILDFRYGRIVITNDTQVAVWWPPPVGAAGPVVTAFLMTLAPGQWYDFRVFLAPWMPLASVYVGGSSMLETLPVAFETPWIDHGGVWLGGNSSSGSPIEENAHAEALWDDFVLSMDSDGDGLSDWEEVTPGSDGYLTDPGDPDTDGDLLIDGLEVGVEWLDADPGNVTSPIDADSDDDGRWDGNEDLTKDGRWDVFKGIRETDPLVRDTDEDALADGQEVGLAWPDGYSSYTEWLADPNSDTRGGPDGFRTDADGGETTTDPLLNDTDLDQLPDGWIDGWWDGGILNEQVDPGEFEDSNTNGLAEPGPWIPTGGGGETDPRLVDSDRDGLLDREEVDIPANPILADGDSDGMPDGWEVEHDLHPTIPDGDGDADSEGWTNLAEYLAGTDPRESDTDSDLLEDDEDPDPLAYNIRASPGDILANPDLGGSESILFNGNVFIIGYAFDFAAPPLDPVNVEISPSGVGEGNLNAILVRFHIELSFPLSFSAVVKVRYAESSLGPATEENDLLAYYAPDSSTNYWTLARHTAIQEDTGREPGHDYAWLTTKRVGDFAVADSTENDIDGDGKSDGEELNVAGYDPWVETLCDVASDGQCLLGDGSPNPAHERPSWELGFGDGGDLTLYARIPVEDGAFEYAAADSPELELTFQVGVAATPFVDVSGDWLASAIIHDEFQWSQSFVAPETANLGAVEVHLCRTGVANPLLLRVLTSNRWFGWGDYVQAADVSICPEHSMARVDFTTVDWELVGGNSYWIELSSDSSCNCAEETYYWRTTGGYSAGVASFTTDGGQTWTDDPSHDTEFRVFEDDYPSDLEVDVVGPGGPNWQDPGGSFLFVSLTDANTNPVLSDETTSFLGAYQSDCDADGCNAFEGNLYLPIKIHSDTPGTVLVSDFQLWIDALAPSPATEEDSDGDGLGDSVESLYFPCNYPTDTDGDSLPDGADDWDTDGDGLSDGQEVREYGTSPCAADSDGDGLNDYDEVVTHRTDPWNEDSDGDLLEDGVEVSGGTDPWNPDTDDDGWRDDEDPSPVDRNPLEWWGLSWWHEMLFRPFCDPKPSTDWCMRPQSQFQASWENYVHPTHIRLLRTGANVMASVRCEPVCELTDFGVERIQSLRNEAVWADTHGVYLMPNLHLGSQNHWPLMEDRACCQPDPNANLDGRYIERVGTFVEELVNDFRESEHLASYRRILAYEIENEMNNPSVHDAWTWERQWNLLAGGSEAVRLAEERTGVLAFRGSYTPLLFNPSYDRMVSADAHYDTLRWYVENVLGDPRSRFDIVAFDYYPVVWTPVLDSMDIVTIAQQLTTDFGASSQWDRTVVIAETGWSTDGAGPGSAQYEDQRDYYRELSTELKRWYWQNGGRAAGFRGLLWYMLFDEAREGDDDAYWLWWHAREKNFGLIEVPPGMNAVGGYGRGEFPKDAWLWLRHELTP